MKNKHQPVMLDEVLEQLRPQKGESLLDLTAGRGGHARAILEITREPTSAVLVDRDHQAVSYLKQHFPQSQVLENDFLSTLENLTKTKKRFDMILADLGLSSPQLEDRRRGFSFRLSGPLDMRMDERHELDAAKVLNTYSENQLLNILKDYGEEPKARQIARQITIQRPLESTEELAAIARKAWPGHSKVDPATRTFQAIRIAVNDELGQIEKALPLMLDALRPSGRLAVITFHSLEDRIVKKFLKDNSQGYDAQLELLTKKPLLAAKTETVLNPRARSAKLRAAVKIKTNTERN